MVLLSMDVGLECALSRVDAQLFGRGHGELTLIYQGIEKSEGANSLDDGDRTRDDARIMSAAYLEGGVCARGEVDAVLLDADRWRWLDRTAPDDRGSGGDAPKDASGVVRLRHYAFMLVAIWVIILEYREGCSRQSLRQYSTPFTAGMPNAAFAMRFSMPSNIGSPTPTGMP